MRFRRRAELSEMKKQKVFFQWKTSRAMCYNISQSQSSPGESSREGIQIMSTANLRYILAESQADIFSTVSSSSQGAPRLRALQEAAFSCILSLLAGEDSRAIGARISAAARNAASHHSMAELIEALDQLESAILHMPRRGSPQDTVSEELLRTMSFFCDARRAVLSSYPRQQSQCGNPGPHRGANPGGEEERKHPSSIRHFDEVMHHILNPSAGPDHVLKMICEGILQMTDADAVTIHVVDSETGEFALKQFMFGPLLKDVAEKQMSQFLKTFAVIPRERERTQGLFDLALREKRVVFSSDIRTDSRVYFLDDLCSLGVTTMLVIPMFASGKELGFVTVVQSTVRTFSPDETERLTLFADQAAVAWRNAELYSELRESEKRYRDLIENAIDIIFILDTEGKFVFANRRGEQVLGFKVEDWMGRHFSEIVSEEDLPTALEGWSRGLRGGAAPMSIKIKDARGEEIYLELNSSLIEEQGQLKGVMCIARDTTEAKRREDDFKRLHASVVEANRRLEDSMEKLKAAQTKLIQTEKLSAMGEVVSGVAHELNNPLTGIMGYSQLLLESISASELREKIERINHEALRCKRIVQNLLGFARTHRPRKQETDMNQVIRSVIDLREYQIRSDGIDLVTLLDSEPTRVIGDFHQLQQVILNILNNAHQAIMSSGTGKKIEAKTFVDTRASRVCVTVSDDGPGISEENLPRIFDPFFTTKEIGEGTGLGLSVAYGIIQEHCGQITVKSTPAEGTVVRVVLPLLGSQPQAEQTRPLAREKPHANKERVRVLVVDDEEVILDLLTDVLAQMNFAVERARNGKEALEKVASTSVDFIICDLKMPGMDGKALFHKIQEVNPHLAKRMIFSTGDTLNEDFREFRAATNCRVVEKPFLIEDLKNAIAAVVSA